MWTATFLFSWFKTIEIDETNAVLWICDDFLVNFEDCSVVRYFWASERVSDPDPVFGNRCRLFSPPVKYVEDQIRIRLSNSFVWRSCFVLL
jgi:hypothetical protein